MKFYFHLGSKSCYTKTQRTNFWRKKSLFSNCFDQIGQSKGKKDWDSVFITKSGDSQLTKNHCQNHNERRKEVRSPATAVGDWPASRFPRAYIIRQLRASGAFSWNNHCQRHHGPKALSALTPLTPLVQSITFNKHWKLGQTSASFCMAKGMKLWQIPEITLTNPTVQCNFI